jgi:rare lipoprotein A
VIRHAVAAALAKVPEDAALRGVIVAVGLAMIVAGCAQQAVVPEVPPAPPAAPAPPPTPAPPPAPAAPTPDAAGQPGETQRGRVSLYGEEFGGKTTASGERFDPEGLTMAHRTLPFGTRVRVTNLENQRSVVVTVNDRGPFVAGRIADLSLGAARQIGMVANGVVDAILEVVRAARGRPP